MPTYYQDEAIFDAEIDILYRRAFGPARFVKAAHFLRVGNICDYSLSRICKIDGKIVGACRMWYSKDANGNNAVFLGPIAVEKEYRMHRIGRDLILQCLELCDANNIEIVFLVGDADYFGQFGFRKIPYGQIKLPLPVDDNRLLWRLKTNEPKLSGLMSPLLPPHKNR